MLIIKFKYFLFFILILMISCGLPNYVSVASPVPDVSNDKFLLQFKTPSKDTIGATISGYALFYKVYASNSEEDDEKYFDESYYSSKSNKELQPGDDLLRKRGFFLASSNLENSGLKIPSSSNPLVILEEGLDKEISINFDTGTVATPFFEVNNKKYQIGRGCYNPKNTDQPLEFFDDWAYGKDTKDLKSFDGDLIRPASASKSNKKAGITLDNEIKVAFAVYTIAVSTSGIGIPELIYSKPVYLGRILIQNPTKATDRPSAKLPK